jgi:hypothetical protein
VFADTIPGVSDKETRGTEGLVTIFATKNNCSIYHYIDDGYARLIRQSQRSLSLAERAEMGKMLEGIRSLTALVIARCDRPEEELGPP